ncbi:MULTISPECIES: sigma-54 dependent transcriptional regulator [unclassified Neptuniibacter]|uniref:sigma-54-dependent transcriptional regulator n=1 Tax=unclassified Neptuniibacter TaxID=2630693 RepID=UPI000C6452C1|nr:MULTISPECIES: sigma-54 dependent transcriptional regulator [unclassified Neptuniibacter]MAY42570.1 sigma-54-dependent Fis family transcriptional regulator [Oceanospirillaceae bacterium]|tara:strand:+ start:29659 stop:31113 length:1455 start_codon:yes stop_codon:yes gene_type:complete
MQILKRPTVLCVDDEIRSLETLERTLDEDFDVLTASNADQAMELLEVNEVHAILCDQRMPGKTGVEFLTEVRQRWPQTARLILSGYTDSEDIIRGLNEAGILQYITKPWHPDNLLLIMRGACRLYELQNENELLAMEMRLTEDQAEKNISQKKQRLQQSFQLDEIRRHKHSPLNDLCEQTAKIAPYDVSVLVTGPSGAGKELFARALHYNSCRADRHFVVENCGAMPDELLASELFGHKKGSFTGAISDHVGLFEQADGGTIFLDEIGEISPSFQVKLLRVLQEREVRRLGEHQRRAVNVRVVASTNRDLEEEVRAGRFRQDLYFRLAEVTLELPALEKRAVDIPVLAEGFLEKAVAEFDKPVKGFTEEALGCMSRYCWPGNVRELQNEVRRMLVLSTEDRLSADLLSPRVLRAAPIEETAETEVLACLDGTLKERIEGLEKRILRETLIRHRWNKSQASRELGLSRVGLRSKLERYGLNKDFH